MVRGWILVLDDSWGRVDGKALRVCNYIRARKHRNDVYPGTVYEFIRWAIIIGAQRTYHQHAVPVSAAYFVCTFTPRYIWQTQISYYWTNTQGPIAIPADWVELENGSLSTVELRWSIPLGKHDVPCSITQHRTAVYSRRTFGIICCRRCEWNCEKAIYDQWLSTPFFENYTLREANIV